MKTTMPTRAFFAGLLLAAGLTHADYSAWSGTRDIVLNTTATGANIANNVIKFPVLVRLTNDEAAIITASKPGGADIRFSKADGVTALPYQIDSWEPWGAAIWVLVDTVYANNSTQKIVLHYGNANANSESNGNAVFDTANGYVGVWHLGNAAGASPRPNSVVGAPTATFRNAPITQQPVRGIIGMADSLAGGAGSDDGNGNEAGLGMHINLSGSSTTPYAGYSDFSAGMTYSVWVNANDNYKDYERFLQMVDDTTWSAANSSGTRIMFLRHVANDSTLTIRAQGQTSNPNSASAKFTQHKGTWRHVAYTKGGANTPYVIYVDGAPFFTFANSAAIPVSSRQFAWIGRSHDPANSYLNAKVDAPMMSKVQRSADFIKLSYENQKKANSLVNIGLGGDVTGTPYSEWNGHRTITLNTTASGANVTADVTNFPVLIRLTAAEAAIRNASKADGSDIRFSKIDDATAIPFHIESWDSLGAAIWVKLDTVKGNSNTQQIRMHWNNPTATSLSNAAAVFDTANGYVAVWHMNGATGENDVTGNGLHAAATGTVANPAGLIGRARAFSNTENFLSVPGSATGKLNFSSETDYTLSAWVYSDEVVSDASTGHAIVNKGNDQWLIGIYGNDEAKYYDVMTRGNGSWNQAATSAEGKEITAQTGVKTWRHVVGTWKGSGATEDTARIYINGALANQTTFANIPNNSDGRNLTYDVFIGVLGGASPSRAFVGRIDEVTASGVVRDSNWIKLAYQNQKPGNSLVDIGTYVAPVAPSAPTAVTAANAATVGTVTVSWTASATDGGAAISAYTVTSAPGALTCTATPPATTCAVTGLTSGTTYTFTVTATNLVGASVASAPSGAVLIPTSLLPGSFVIRMDGTTPYSYRIPATLVSSTERLTMTIVNVHGKRVWSKTINPAQSKVSELTWNGLTANGMRASAGMYIVRIEAKMNGQTITSEHKGVNLKP